MTRDKLSHEQRYFVYLWSALLSSPTYRHLHFPLVGTSSLLEEFLYFGERTGTSSQFFHPKHLGDLSRELRIHLQQNPFIAATFPNEMKVLSQCLSSLEKEPKNPTNISAGTLAVRSLSDQIATMPFLDKLVDSLVAELGGKQAKYHTIDHLTLELLNELKYQGHSSEHLYRWGAGVFVYDPEVDFLLKLQRLKDLGEGCRRSFTCVFKLVLPDGFSIPGSPALMFEDALPHELESEAAGRFASPEVCYAVAGEEACDRFAAARAARRRILNLVSLYCLHEPAYEPNMSRDALVVDKGGERPPIIIKAYREVGLISLRTLPIFFKMAAESQKGNCNRDTTECIRRVLHWCRVASDSPLEGRYLALWAALEFLLSGRTAQILPSIVESLPAFVCSYYPKSGARDLWHGIRKGPVGASIPNALTERFVVEQGGPVEKIDEAAFLKTLLDEESRWEGALQYNDGALRHMRWWKAALQDRSIPLKRINGVEQLVQFDVCRMYRLRNLLIHRAPVRLAEVEENLSRLAYYVSRAIDQSLFFFQTNPGYSIDQLLFGGRKDYDLMVEGIKESKSVDQLITALIEAKRVFRA